MGASSFLTISYGNTVEQAFNDAVQEAKYEYGHGGYTGTIAEKRSYFSCSKTIFDSKQKAIDYADQLFDDEDHAINNKWGPAGYVQFKDGNNMGYLFFGWASC